jgi:hypothetical protein
MADLTVRGLAKRSKEPAPASARDRFFSWIAASAAMLLVLAAPALWNGFPIIFPDTGGYLTRPLEGTLDIGRSALYGLFLLAGMPLAFWPVVFVQAAATAWLIVLLLRVHGFPSRPWLAAGIVVLLSIFSSLPWLTSQLLPDILFPAAVIALYLLVFVSERLARWEQLALAALIAFAIASHMAAAALCVGLAALLWLLGYIGRLDLPMPRLGVASSAVVAGIILGPTSNWAITGMFAFTPGGTSFVFGRLIEDGIVGRYLNEHCPDPTIRLCDYRASLPPDADGWLWDPDSPYRKLQGWQGHGKEAHKIILDTIIRYPLMHAASAARDVVEQLTSFQTEVSLDDNAPTIEALQEWAPQLMPAVMRSRQQARTIDVDAINLVQVPVATLAMAGLAGTLPLRRRLKLTPEASAFGLTVLSSLLINAVICAVFAHAVDRYQSRLIPLVLLALALLAASRWRRSHLGAPRLLS